MGRNLVSGLGLQMEKARFPNWVRVLTSKAALAASRFYGVELHDVAANLFSSVESSNRHLLNPYIFSMLVTCTAVSAVMLVVCSLQ